MAEIVFIHWNDTEARERSQPLAEAGHRVRLHANEGGKSPMPPLPEVLVISLDRLPTHGGEIADWLWEAKSRRSIPIVFVGGAADKVSMMRAKFPSARFCARGALVSTVAAAARAAAAMRGESGDPKPGTKGVVIAASSAGPAKPAAPIAKVAKNGTASTKPAPARAGTATATRARRKSA